jgi:hypothetical protein
MKILSVSCTEREGGIPLPDLESVKGALQAFSEGRTQGSDATRNQLVKDGGGMAAAMMTLVQPSPGTFVDRLCQQMEQSLSQSDQFYRDFDYDGVGSFFKSNVKVKRLSDGTYLLELSAAYVGNEVEKGLAEYLGIQRGLWWTKLTITLDAIEGDNFKIDFDPINDKLGGTVLWTHSGKDIAKLIAAGKTEDYSSRIMDGGIVTLMGGELRDTVDPSSVDGQLTVTMAIDDMSVGRYYEQAFEADGSVVIGPRETRWSQPGEEKYPSVGITVTGNPLEDRFNRLPVLDPEVQVRMRELVNDLKVRFES